MPTRQQMETQYIQDRAFWGSIGGRWRGLAGGVLWAVYWVLQSGLLQRQGLVR